MDLLNRVGEKIKKFWVWALVVFVLILIIIIIAVASKARDTLLEGIWSGDPDFLEMADLTAMQVCIGPPGWGWPSKRTVLIIMVINDETITRTVDLTLRPVSWLTSKITWVGKFTPLEKKDSDTPDEQTPGVEPDKIDDIMPENIRVTLDTKMMSLSFSGVSDEEKKESIFAFMFKDNASTARYHMSAQQIKEDEKDDAKSEV